ncbi:Rieske 2Fe-2S domain-containing protein [Sphingomonas sp.]|uniref:Rieske 2Fe-2S domain-containing protein n=1 Tax=Sphingomonas sp. TaxID=28214 RepID=UPI003D6CAD61
MNYVRNAWYVAAWSHDLKPGEPLSIHILDEPIVLWRNDAGILSALQDRCVHRLAPLSLGRCEGDKLRCMYHGMLYNREGVVVEIPGQDMISDRAKVRAYPIAERHSWVWIWMGDPAGADEALIPPAMGLDDPHHILGHGQLDYAAEARLINDNLLDFSHLSYVHAGSFGSSETWARTRPTIKPLERGVRIGQWIEGELAPGEPEGGKRTDNYNCYDYLIPGVLLMAFGSFPAGTAARLGGKVPDLADAEGIRTFSCQAVTPMTAKTSRYFFSMGPHRDYGDEAVRDMILGVTLQAFEEDRAMIEAQQRVIDVSPDIPFMPNSSDRATTLFTGLEKKLSREEGGQLRKAS